ncbi:PilW family protein [Paenibacillus sp. MSJ-34]|uniref:PilW family protein n=1 Tax=Paenibacillus sp. MSJ-34 TaxID=2841529 RepID=UPI001C11F206|nr:prepilin-type N-terminal cleavage/methylation domain-containing protein [Paenibacillus sp. MSJ-34]MBU5444992.1 prepilin-type N-terminal cleavage/methylation domain-containing protein [Paenibacillus sp. MSJ-34]
MRKRKLDQKGITLIEVLAGMVLLSLVLGLAVSAYAFGVGAFDSANRRSELQDNVRLASMALTNELRYAEKVELLAACPSSLEAHYNYICLDSGAAAIVQHRYNESSSTHDTGLLADTHASRPAIYQLEFNKDLTANTLLTYTIKADSDRNTFEVATNISLLNIELHSGSIVAAGTAPYQAIAYKKLP